MASTKELRSFGLLVGGLFSVIGLWPAVVHGDDFRAWAVILGGLLMAGGGIHPRLLAPIHKGWMRVGHVLGWVNTRILLGVVFYGLVTPIGVVLRMMGKNTMQQAFVDGESTYRVVRPSRPPSHMKNQF
ncbi:SxtJ family membrane protein [Petrachloros mirabilis]